MIALKYTSAEYVYALEVVGDQDATFTFKTKEEKPKKYKIKKVQAFLFSKRVAQILSHENTINSYKISTLARYTNLVQFFDDLKNDMITFNKDNVNTVLSLVDELRIEGAREGVECYFLSQLFDEKISRNKTSKELYQMASENIQEIRCKLPTLPYIIREKIFILRPKFENEDEYATSMMENFMKPYAFEHVKFELLSKKLMKRVLNYVGRESSLFNNFISRIVGDIEAPPEKIIVFKEKKRKENIKVLHIYPDRRNCFKCDFFGKMNDNEYCNISCTLIGSDGATNIFLNYPQLMDQYDVILIGGSDCNISPSRDFIEQCINRYRSRGGIILMLHDGILYSNYDRWTSDLHIFEITEKPKDYPRFTSAVFKDETF